MMSTEPQTPKVVESFTRPNGFDFDPVESFTKLAASQFGGHPSRGFCELVQNAIDSYGDGVPMEKRRITIDSSPRAITVRDTGEGMSRNRLELMTTLGGTDKAGSTSKIGQFGIGFFAIFNPALGARRVDVHTICEGRPVRLTYLIDASHPERPPAIDTCVGEPFGQASGSAITVTFAAAETVASCLQAAAKFLKYLPCTVMIDGKPFTDSVWSHARREGVLAFSDDGVHGYVHRDTASEGITILCRYERVCEVSLQAAICAAKAATEPLRDYRREVFPFVPRCHTVVNSNNLQVTVSRDSVRVDSNYRQLLGTLRNRHMELLLRILNDKPQTNVLTANQYVLANDVATYVADPRTSKLPKVHYAIAEALARAKIYGISGEAKLFSLLDIARRRSSGYPVYFSPSGNFAKWLGGAFTHDFVVLPPRTSQEKEINDLYDIIFARVFHDTVNLDTIEQDRQRLEELVTRGLVDAALLSPKCRLVGAREQTAQESEFVDELNALLADTAIVDAVARTLFLDVASIEAVLFDLQEGKMTVATGLFDEDGTVLDNLGERRGDGGTARRPDGGRRLSLGLRRGHPVVDHLMRSRDPCRVYYSLTFVAHELVRCQRRLAPYSAYRKWVMSDLMRRMRQVIIERMLGDTGQQGEYAA